MYSEINLYFFKKKSIKMELLNKVKTELEKSKNYDFASEIFDEEIMTIVYDVVYATEDVLKFKTKSSKLSNIAEFILSSKPSVKIGLDDHYGKQTVLNAINEALNKTDVMRSAWVVYNINGDVIGVADSYEEALSIYEGRYGDTPEHPEESINKFEVNRLHYA